MHAESFPLCFVSLHSELISDRNCPAQTLGCGDLSKERLFVCLFYFLGRGFECVLGVSTDLMHTFLFLRSGFPHRVGWYLWTLCMDMCSRLVGWLTSCVPRSMAVVVPGLGWRQSLSAVGFVQTYLPTGLFLHRGPESPFLIPMGLETMTE